MSNREIILGRIREALKRTAPRPSYTVADEESPTSFAPSPQRWLPPVGATLAEQIELFGKNAEALKAEFVVCKKEEEALGHLQTLAKAYRWKKIGCHNGALLDTYARSVNLPQVKVDGGYGVDDLESCDAGLTECEALVAQTGSVLVSALSSGGRALSVLPPHHVVLARREQMVSDLSAAFQRVQKKFNNNFPSFLCLISGPSRTGDIERTLVLGAHGPKMLTILLLP